MTATSPVYQMHGLYQRFEAASAQASSVQVSERFRPRKCSLSLARPCQSLACEPSQNTGLALCLHPQRYAVLVSVASNFTGRMSVVLWLPSQKGWLALNPQEHQK
jgi:hypothetical protein